MSCNHQLVFDHINDYVENKTSTQINQQIESVLNSCSECQETYKNCLELYQMSQQWEQQEVPEWHRTSYAVRPPVSITNWLNWGAMATSTVAILMVVFQLEITTSNNGLMISFGGNQTKSKITEMVEKQLVQYKQQLDKSFDVKLTNVLENQNNLVKARLANWQQQSRTERQQEFKFVMTGWQSQRYEDQKNVDRQLSYMADNQIENNQALNQLLLSASSKQKRKHLRNSSDL